MLVSCDFEKLLYSFQEQFTFYDSKNRVYIKGIVHLQLVPIDLHSVFFFLYTVEVNRDQHLKVTYLFNLALSLSDILRDFRVMRVCSGPCYEIISCFVLLLFFSACLCILVAPHNLDLV